MASKAQLLALAAVLAIAPAASADEFVTQAPAELEAIRVDEHLGAQVPLDLRFRDHTGAEVALADFIKGDLPVVLSFNYSNCPMLCSMQLDGIVDGLATMQYGAGGPFRLLTVVIEPKETFDRAADTRDGYLGKLERKAANEKEGKYRRQAAASRDGWTFLVAAQKGDDAAIRRLADTVGVRYRYVDERAEWAHPAVLVFLSPSGTITRYMHGIQYDPAELTTSVVRAGVSEPSAAAGFLQRCAHWEPTKNSKAAQGVAAMKIGAAAFAALVIGALVLAHVLRRASRAASNPSVPEDTRP